MSSETVQRIPDWVKVHEWIKISDWIKRPEWIKRPGSRTTESSQRPALRETAWLDGLRGVAAFLVVMNHYHLEWLSIFSDAPFGARVLKDYNPDGVYYYEEGTRFWGFWRLPILRLFTSSGNAQVSIFFILSGFVLSWRPIELARTNRLEELSTSLSSSIVRRWFRLYLPCFVMMCIYVLEGLIMKPPGGPTSEELLAVFAKILPWASPFKTDYVVPLYANPPINYPMWTIPFEFSGSMFIFGFILALSTVQDYRRRMGIIIFVTMYAFFDAFWNYWLFGFGLALADYVRQANGCANISKRATALQTRVWVAVLMTGLVLMSYKSSSDDFTRPGYSWTKYVPLPGGFRANGSEGRFWQGWGAICVVTSCCHLALARRMLELRVIQYMGKISFMLYLSHLLVNSLVSLPLKERLYDGMCSKFTDGPFEDVYRTSAALNVLIYFILLLVSVLVAVCLAHVLELLVDRPCTNFGKWINKKVVHGFRTEKQEPASHEDAALLPQQEMEQEDPRGGDSVYQDRWNSMDGDHEIEQLRRTEAAEEVGTDTYDEIGKKDDADDLSNVDEVGRLIEEDENDNAGQSDSRA